jgi:hypothetical protein
MIKNKIIIDILFIALTAIILTGLDYLELLEKYSGYVLIPIVAAYYIGQQIERKFRKSRS